MVIGRQSGWRSEKQEVGRQTHAGRHLIREAGTIRLNSASSPKGSQADSQNIQ